MSFTPHGKHLVAGDWIESGQQFWSEPAFGPSHAFSVGTVDLVDKACVAAAKAFWRYSQTIGEERAVFLEAIADAIDERAAAIISIAMQETGLTETRLRGECSRTIAQARLFADHIRSGLHLDQRFDRALPDREPVPRPEIRLIHRPIGPVAVFGASNFPLAFSVAGGDTVAALAAGCPVVVKGHSAHPGTSEIVAAAIQVAIDKCELPQGTFSLIQGGRRDVGAALVQHPEIMAVGFTGSLAGGRALFDLCMGRANPIPFFGKLGSVNPMFLLPGAIAARGDAIAKGWAASMTLGAGQFCTNPGIAVVMASQADGFAEDVCRYLLDVEPQTMLTKDIAAAFRSGRARVAAGKGVRPVLTTTSEGRAASPILLRVSASDWLADPSLAEEVFGPLGLLVVADSEEQMAEVAASLNGQLTATLHLDAEDNALARRLMPMLEHKAGRVLANGFPTGVEVCDAMVHGGPYPASTNFGATSVGTLSIRRFLRPISYQNIPDALLPRDLVPARALPA